MSKVEVSLNMMVDEHINNCWLHIPEHTFAGEFNVYKIEYSANKKGGNIKIDSDCVIKYSSKYDAISVGKEMDNYILTPKGYKIARPLYIEAIKKYKPTYERLNRYHPKFNTPITIEDVDTTFSLAWNLFIKNSRRRMDSLRKTQKALNEKIEKINKFLINW